MNHLEARIARIIAPRAFAGPHTPSQALTAARLRQEARQKAKDITALVERTMGVVVPKENPRCLRH